MGQDNVKGTAGPQVSPADECLDPEHGHRFRCPTCVAKEAGEAVE